MYVFPGVHPFIEAVAARSGRDLHQIGRTHGIWHVARIQDALGQLPRVDPKGQVELLAYTRAIRDGLALALEGVDAAIEEVTTELGVMVPRLDVRATTTTTTKRKG